ncbi:vitamin K epoxide reductase family protein [Pontibacter sp. MBLB2868]|uniref:vitamin K epoxide reductase family protein n=1 Tax=Pontibacter sp. MBLB2868 TaxID=3451555 RepID=UPI003F74E8BA
MHQPMRYVVSRLLRRNDVRVDAEMLEQKLTRHPYFPSLLSVSDVLHELGISHQAYRTDVEELISNFSKPVLIFLTSEGGMFAVVESLTKERVKVFTDKGDMQQYTVEEFSKIWNGTVLNLKATGERKSRQPESKDNITYPVFVRYVLLICWLFVAACLLQRITLFKSPLQTTLMLFSLVGTGVCWLLVLQHLNKNIVLVKQLCDSSTNKGCNSVLSSKAAQLMPWLSMAEAGFIYFSGIAALLFSFNVPVLFLYLALIAPLFSFYAVYLQAVVLKVWCKLCMVVHGVLLACFVGAVWHMVVLPFQYSIPSLEQITAFILPGLVWVGVKPLVRQLKEGRQYKNEYRRLKANPELFSAMLSKQVKVHIPEELKLFTFGNPVARYEFVMVSNPFCGPCSQAHSLIHDWLESDLDFKVTVIFIHQDETDPKRQFVELLSGAEDTEGLNQALHDWFESDAKDLTSWSIKHQLQVKPLSYHDTKLKKWLDMAEVRGTPTFFINGRRLPDTYRMQDIRYLITEAE